MRGGTFIGAGRRPPRSGMSRMPLGTDARATAVTAIVYGFALGAGTLVLPLLALDVGYSPSQVGLLAAASGVAQIGVRLTLGAFMCRWPDRLLVTCSAALLAVPFFGIAMSTSAPVFILAHLLVGASRACFWTGLQTHVVREDAHIVKRLARVNLLANAGLLAGPVAAGVLLQTGNVLVLAVIAVAGTAAAVCSLSMRRLPPFVPPDASSRPTLLRRPAVLAGCAAVGVAGTWRGLIGSYVPIVLSQAGQSARAIGILIAIGNAANTLSAAPYARIMARTSSAALRIPTLASAASCGLIGYAAGNAVLAAVLLVAGGAGAGALQILGSALAAEAVDGEERGNAMAVTGTARAVAMFTSPMSVAGLLQVMAVSPALAVVGGVLTLPVLLFRRRA
jgi:MFS family permease